MTSELSRRIQELIEFVKAQSKQNPGNSLRYNKVIGRLDEAWVHSLQIGMPIAEIDRQQPVVGSTCTCPEGARSAICPIHRTG